MPSFPLTPTRDAASCPTFLGRTAEAVWLGGADCGCICGGKSEIKITPPKDRKWLKHSGFGARAAEAAAWRVCISP